jgi:hypothetical protein
LIPLNFIPPVLNPGQCLSSWPQRIPNNGFAGTSHASDVIASGGAGGDALQNPGQQFAGGYAGHGGGAGYAGGGGGGPSDYCSWSDATGRLKYYTGRPGGGAGGSSYVNTNYFNITTFPTILDQASAPSTSDGQVTITYLLPPGVSSVQGPAGLQGDPFLVQFSVPVKGVTTTSLFASQMDNPAPGTGSVACLDPQGVDVSCVTGPVMEARYVTPGALLPGEYYRVFVNTAAPGVVTFDNGTLIPPTQQTVRAKTSFTAFDYPLKYQWGKVKAKNALGGSYVTDSFGGSTARATITVNTQSEPGLAFWGGPAQGIARVTVNQNGNQVSSFDVDTYRKARGSIFQGLGTLNAGTYRVTVEVLGAKNAASTGYGIGLDGTTANGVVTTSPKLVAMWPNYPGEYAYDGTKGAKVSLSFRGTSVDWTALVGPNNGYAKVTIDGVVVDAARDLYAGGYTYQTFAYGGLTDSVHQLVVSCVGDRNPLSSANIVTIKGLTVH